jgi:hypothetical protein
MPTQANLMGSGCPALQAQASVGMLTTASNNLTATGAAQNSLTLPSDFNVYTTVTLNNGPTLPATGPQCNAADSFILVNHGANAMNVWPPTGGKIGTGSANAAVSVPVGKVATFLSLGSGNFAWSLSA